LATHFESLETLVAKLKMELNANTVVLVKGSRSMQMERVADALIMKKEELQERENAPCC
jgi:UDP-N-acetylmuramoyl-tripeptide--D-alanyl-D-alanine ligase